LCPHPDHRRWQLAIVTLLALSNGYWQLLYPEDRKSIEQPGWANAIIHHYPLQITWTTISKQHAQSKLPFA
jgi:hypothetical protein